MLRDACYRMMCVLLSYLLLAVDRFDSEEWFIWFICDHNDIFGRALQITVRPMLWHRYPVCPVCLSCLSYPILEHFQRHGSLLTFWRFTNRIIIIIIIVCGFGFYCFGFWLAHFQRIGAKFPTELKLSNADLYSVVNETGNTNRILGMCKFQFRFRLVHCGTIMPTILYRFSPNFACGFELMQLL